MYTILTEKDTGMEVAINFAKALRNSYEQPVLLNVKNVKDMEELFKKLLNSKDVNIKKAATSYMGLESNRKQTYYNLIINNQLLKLHDLEAYRRKHLKETLIIQSGIYLYEVKITSYDGEKLFVELLDRLDEDADIIKTMIMENRKNDHLFNIYLDGGTNEVLFTKSKVWMKS